MNPSIHPFIHSSTHSSIYMSNHLFCICLPPPICSPNHVLIHPFISLNIYVVPHLLFHMSFHLPFIISPTILLIYLFIHVFIHPFSVHSSSYPSTSTYPHDHSSIYPAVHLPIHPSTHLPTHLSTVYWASIYSAKDWGHRDEKDIVPFLRSTVAMRRWVGEDDAGTN